MTEERKQRKASEVLSDVSEATISLSCLPRVIHSTIDNLKLGEADLTEEDIQNIGRQHKTIYDLLTLVQFTIYETERKLEAIPILEEPRKIIITKDTFKEWLEDQAITPKDIAEALNIDLEEAECKIYDVNLFTLSEVKTICKGFEISADLMAYYADLERGQA